jgi:phenylalanyl-tRNA synthetase beta chain
LKWDDILAAINTKKPALLQNVLFVDEYKGKQVPEGKKSMTIRLVIGSGEKTLTSAEIEQVANNIIKKLTKTLSADIRSV